jgi:large subunit ribosomal protein L4
MKLKFHKADGSSAGERDFDIPLFEGDNAVALLKQAIIGYQANLRQGNASSKNYGEVAGSGKKMLPQKGSGGSRHGDKRAPQLYKGGVVFGPRPRDWSKSIPATQRRKALGRALFDLASAGGLAVIERFEVAQPKTKLFAQVLRQLDTSFPQRVRKPAAEGKRKRSTKPRPLRVLLVDAAWAEPFRRASRNVSRASFTNSTNLNALDLVTHGNVVITEKALVQVLARAVN